MAKPLNPNAPVFVPRTQPSTRPSPRQPVAPVKKQFRCGRCYSSYDDSVSHNNGLCDKCNHTIDQLCATSPEDDDVTFLHMTFTKHEVDHDGYCSDPVEKRVTEKKVRMVFPVPMSMIPDNITTDDVFKHDEIGDAFLFQLMTPLPRSNSSSGWCGCGWSYQLHSIRLSDKPTKCDNLRTFLTTSF